MDVNDWTRMIFVADLAAVVLSCGGGLYFGRHFSDRLAFAAFCVSMTLIALFCAVNVAFVLAVEPQIYGASPITGTTDTRVGVWLAAALLGLFSLYRNRRSGGGLDRNAAGFNEQSPYRNLLDVIHDGHIRADRDGIIRDASDSALAILGCSRAELIGTPAEQFYRRPKDREKLLQSLDRAGGALRVDAVNLVRRDDGRPIHVSFAMRRLYDGSDCDGGLEAFVRDGTAELEATEARRESEERFRAFAELSSDWLYETDSSHRLVWLSDSFSERSAVAPGEILGTRLWDSNVSSIVGEEGLAEQQRIMEAHEPYGDFVYSLTNAAGEIFWRRSSARPRFAQDGRFLGYRGSTSDITQQLSTERSFRNLIENLPDAIFIQRDDIILYTNPMHSRMFGAELPDAYIGQDSLVLFHPDEHPNILGRRRLLRDGKKVDSADRQCLHRSDGSTFIGEGTGTAIVWEGKPAIMVMLRDISTRVAAEDARRSSVERFRDFAGSTSDWFWETDGDLRIAWLSETFATRTGQHPSNVIGRRLWETDGSRTFEMGSFERCRPLMEAREPFRNLRYRVRSPDGGICCRTASGQPLYADDGTFAGYRGSTADITAEVETELRFQNLIEASPDAVFVHRDNRILYVNPAMVRIFAAESAESFIGTDPLAIYAPEARSRVLEFRRQLDAGATVTTAQMAGILRRDGTEFAAEGSATAIGWEGKSATMVILRDVSERVAVEEARRASEAQYRLLAEMMPEAFIIQSGGMVVYANAAARKIFSSPAGSDLTGTIGLEIVAEESRDWALARRLRVMETGASEGPDLAVHVRGDGSSFESESTIGYLEWKGLPATINIIADVSERIASERELEESEKRFRDFAQSTSDWFWETDPYFALTWFSAERHPLLQGATHDLIGKLPWEISSVDPAESPGWTTLIEDYLAGRKPFRDIVVDGFRPDGTRYFMALSGTPRFDADGGFLGYRGASTDVTTQRDLENRLQQSQKMEAIGQLTGGIAHDFNNLLAIISGNLELLAEQPVRDAESAKFLTPARRAAERGADLTKYLLAFSRQQPLNPRPVNINQLIAGMTDPLRRALGAQIDLETVIAAGGWLAHVDPAQTETAILNLALNARDAMSDGGRLTLETANATLDEEYSAQFEGVTPGRYLMISVSDEGTGIAPELIDRVFDPFVTTKEVGQGSGLGLSMVYGFVKQSGGHVRIFSEVGKGTTIRLYLPKADSTAPDTIAITTGRREPRGDGETVMVVEDDMDVLALVDILLTNQNYRVIKARDATAAIRHIENGEIPDVLLTDVILSGGMTGVDLARKIDDASVPIPVIYMSGYTENTIIHQGVLKEDVLLLSKPFKKYDLATMLKRALWEERRDS